jgi:hypothetical protein
MLDQSSALRARSQTDAIATRYAILALVEILDSLLDVADVFLHLPGNLF